ncbi:MAG TPA: type II toxin-antitoxin system prevent-host-death family antitoxin [Stellaceae bacterium]|jgi:prevent-host-death family protein|nr:type II toxin-antitoxin system prevent-host-death family antitoxin [Stellaceae bacterium]
MREVGAFEAKNKFSELLRRVEAGEEIAITNRGKMVARLVPPHREFDREEAVRAVERIRARRHGITLGGLTLKGLIAEGRE